MIDVLSGPDPFPALAELRATRPVAWVADLDAWLVTRHDLALQVMRDDRTFTVDDPRFSTAQVVGPSMLSLDGDEHRRHRRPFAPAFRAAELQQRFAAPVRATVDGLLDGLVTAGSAELRTAFAGPLSVAVVAHSLGLTDVDVPTVLDWYAAIVGAVTSITSGEPPDPGAARAMRELAGAVARGTGLDGTGLSDDEVVSNAAVMMFGGIETTEGMIATAFAHLLASPALDAVRADGALVPAAVEESLRLDPAAAAVDRYATRDVSLGGADVRAGDLVRVSLTAANRDPAVFPDPSVLDVTRTNHRQQLAFARGPHACLAMDLARLETVTALRVALDRLPGLRLVAPAPVTGLVFRKPQAVRVAW